DELDLAKSCVAIRQKEILVARGSLRILLTRYFPEVPASQWQFKLNTYGKPEICGPVEPKNFSFNVSHSNGYAVFAFGGIKSLGVDVEMPDRAGNLLEIAQSHFAPSELLELQKWHDQKLQARFLQY